MNQDQDKAAEVKDGGPAFPVPNDANVNGQEGMSLRDYFAASALQGCLSYSYVNPARGNYHENCDPDGVAISAYQYADAMLKARAK
jgi:hypothetical protein